MKFLDSEIDQFFLTFSFLWAWSKSVHLYIHPFVPLSNFTPVQLSICPIIHLFALISGSINTNNSNKHPKSWQVGINRSNILQIKWGLSFQNAEENCSYQTYHLVRNLLYPGRNKSIEGKRDHVLKFQVQDAAVMHYLNP